jgi:uncharacterized delta-60 repeat protein
VRLAARAFGGLLLGCLGSAAHAAGWTAALPNGQALSIVEGATATASGYYLERRFGAGIRDPQFGNGGRTFFTMGSDNSPPAALQVDAAGRILVSGAADTGSGRNAAAVLRFLPNGQVDTGWGQQGRSLIAAPRGNASAADALPLADGQVLIIGTIDDEQNERAALWRFTQGGQLDTSFGTAGLVLAAALPQSQGLSLQQSEDGTLHIALEAGRGDKTWLEVHRWKPGAAGPVRFARQEFPEEWVGPPVLLRRGEIWVWTDASQPLTPPLQLVAAAPESVWTPATGAAPAPRGESASPAGHAAVNPFNEAAGANAASTPITLEELAWPGLLLTILALLAAAFWWWWRRG